MPVYQICWLPAWQSEGRPASRPRTRVQLCLAGFSRFAIQTGQSTVPAHADFHSGVFRRPLQRLLRNLNTRAPTFAFTCRQAALVRPAADWTPVRPQFAHTLSRFATGE